MNQKILYLFTRTPLHVGAGSSVGAIDQPVQREKHTGFPVIPGSALKGVLADGADYLKDRKTGTRTDIGRTVFGHEKTDATDAKSGGVSFGEAQLLAFPVRSAQGCFAWLTCPLMLERLHRFLPGIQCPAVPEGMEAFFDSNTLGAPEAVFEDYCITHKGDFTLATELQKLCNDPVWQALAVKHLALVSNDAMSHFVRSCCEVAQHVRIDDDTGTSVDGALFNQENVPAETLFFAPLIQLREGAMDALKVPSVLQMGGDSSTGLGFCTTGEFPQ